MSGRSINTRVSVLCSTYNHANYIRQTLDSMLAQKTNFNFEILINDDHSTDGTSEIIKEYKKKYPNIIKPVLQKENQYNKGVRGMMLRFLLPKAIGEYIALCEGDDFWTDTSKLQRQVDFLEKNRDYTVCFHPVKVIYENEKRDNEVYPKQKPQLTTRELLKWNYIQTNSVMYRRQSLEKVSFNIVPGDWYLHLYHAQFGKIGYVDRVMSVYRRHAKGMWSGVRGDQEKFWLQFGREHLLFFFRILDMYGHNSEYETIILKNIADILGQIFNSTQKGEEILDKLSETLPKSKDIIIKGLIINCNDIEKHLLKEIDDRNNHIEGLTVSLKELEKVVGSKNKEIDDIKSSKVWKLRNKMAKILGKKPV